MGFSSARTLFVSFFWSFTPVLSLFLFRFFLFPVAALYPVPEEQQHGDHQEKIAVGDTQRHGLVHPYDEKSYTQREQQSIG
jgi:hypothetical protein